MNLDPDICYQALLTHDSRFDGKFFVCVKTTHIYCRPVCTVKVPMLKNCTFQPSAAAAERAGYRPCLRCRPELAPGNAKIDAVSRLAAVIANKIEDGALSEMSIAELADEVGISERHLRRVTESEFGVSPLELAQTQRLLLAKQLLTDSTLPITEVAFASGFASVRRFNALFLERYRLNPSQLRNGRKAPAADQVIECDLGYRAPLDWDSLVQFLSARTVFGTEAFVGNTYRRSVEMGDHKGWIEVSRYADRPRLKVKISHSLARAVLPILSAVRRLFDLNADPHAIASHLGSLATNRPGMRLPGTFDSFEMSVRAILGQQVSVKGATTLMSRFVTAFGAPFETPFPEISWLFPTPSTVASQSVDSLSKNIGIPRARANAILALATAIANGELNLSHSVDVEKTIEQLVALPGIGEWTAHYIAMRALNWPDAFPHTDLGIRKALNDHNAKEVLATAEKWRPWRAYAVMHLWKSLEDQQCSTRT